MNKTQSISDRELIHRALLREFHRAGWNYTQRKVVMDLFDISKEEATALCWRFGFNPLKIAGR